MSWEVVTEILPPPSVVALMPSILVDVSVPVCVTEMLALLAAWVTVALMKLLKLPLVLMVRSPLVAPAVLLMLIAPPVPVPVTLPEPLTVMLPVLLEIAEMPVDVDDPNSTSALKVIAVLPLPPVTRELMPFPPVEVTVPLVVMPMPRVPPPVTVALIAVPVELTVTAAVLSVIPPVAVLALMA